MFLPNLYHFTLLIWTLFSTATADTTKKAPHKEIFFPVPVAPAKLFYIQRDPNNNTIVYDLNTGSNGLPNPESPIHVYWIKYNEQSQKEELNFKQRRFAYGVVTTPIGNNNYDVRFVSYKKFKMTLMKWETDNKYHIFTSIGKKQSILNRVFLHIEGGSFWVPNVVYVELKGTDPTTGKEVMERFKP